MGLTQTQLANRLGESQHYVSRYELGERHIDAFQLDAICAALGTTLEEMWTLLRPLMAQPSAPAPDGTDGAKAKPLRASVRRRTAPSPSQGGGSGIGPDAERRVDLARERLERTGDGARSVEEVADSVGWSADHLRRMFRVVLNTSPHQVNVSARLERAYALLLEKALPVAQVGALCGFPNPSHFAQVFRRKFGQTPRQLRGEDEA